MLTAASAAMPAHAELRRITIGANPAGTNFNVVAGAFAKRLQETLGVQSIVRPYSGSSVYIPLLERGEIALGVNSGLDSYLAFTGQAPYAAPMANLRALMAVYPLGYMFWVRAATGMRRIEDLAGRRVVLNYRSLVPLSRLNRAILASGGLTENDVTVVTAAGLPEGARIVTEGRADAVAMGYRLPLVRQTHATLPGGLRFLQMGADEAQVPRLMPGAWVETIIPGPADVGLDGPTRTAMYDTYLNTGTHLSADDVYRIVQSLHRGWARLREDFAILAGIDETDLVPADPPHPYHDGAVEYWSDAGLFTPEHRRHQQELGRRA